MASSQSRWIKSHSSQVPKSPKSRTNALLLLPDHSRVTSTKHPFPCQPYLHLHFPLGTRTQLFLSSISQLALCKIHLETTTWAPTSLLSLVVSSFPSRRLRLLSPRELLSTTETDPSPLPYQTDRRLSSPRRLVSFESLATRLLPPAHPPQSLAIVIYSRILWYFFSSSSSPWIRTATPPRPRCAAPSRSIMPFAPFKRRSPSPRLTSPFTPWKMARK